MTDCWRASIEDDLMTMNLRLVLWRRRGDGRVEVVYPDRVETIDDGTTPAGEPGYPIPREALSAVVEAFMPFAPHKVEVKRLEDALRVERERVDRIITKAVQ